MLVALSFNLIQNYAIHDQFDLAEWEGNFGGGCSFIDPRSIECYLEMSMLYVIISTTPSSEWMSINALQLPAKALESSAKLSPSALTSAIPSDAIAWALTDRGFLVYASR
jgi:hypothetical protein